MVVATTVAAHATVDHSMPLHKGIAIDSGRRLLQGKRLFCWVWSGLVVPLLRFILFNEGVIGHVCCNKKRCVTRQV